MTPVEHLNTVIGDVRSFRKTWVGTEQEKIVGADTLDFIMERLLVHVCNKCKLPPGAVHKGLLKPRQADEGGPLE